MRGPQRIGPLLHKILSDKLKATFEQRHLYSYATSKIGSEETLKAVLRWISQAQRPDGGIAAYYSLLTGYSESYPEVTGYLVPTFYDFAQITGNREAVAAAERATQWLLSLQMSTGSFPGGLQGSCGQASVFNTGQILQGLVRAYSETRSRDVLQAAIAAGDWLIDVQQRDGSWSGLGAYQNSAHSYYSMVAWPLAALGEIAAEEKYGLAAENNLDWVLSHFGPGGWIDGINLRDHPIYLHFIAYVLQGALECAMLRGREDAIEMVANSAWALLRRFETTKYLCGAYDAEFANGERFACLTGNAQMSCVWLRLFETTDDLRYLNAALKMNEMVKESVAIRGSRGIEGGVSGSFPVWGRYQPFRYISWGCKFLADALMLERRLTESMQENTFEPLPCAS
jgi:hypothetical protein